MRVRRHMDENAPEVVGRSASQASLENGANFGAHLHSSGARVHGFIGCGEKLVKGLNAQHEVLVLFRDRQKHGVLGRRNELNYSAQQAIVVGYTKLFKLSDAGLVNSKVIEIKVGTQNGQQLSDRLECGNALANHHCGVGGLVSHSRVRVLWGACGGSGRGWDGDGSITIQRKPTILCHVNDRHASEPRSTQHHVKKVGNVVGKNIFHLVPGITC